MGTGVGELSSAERWRSDRWFYCGIAWTIAALVTAAFSKALLRNQFEPAVLQSPLTLAHAFTFMSWIALFAVQATLITGRRPDIHRKLGIFGVILACVMVLLITISVTRALALGLERYFFANPPIGTIGFTILIIPAFLFRHDPDVHKRLVLLATISLLGPATTHIPFIGRISQYAYLVAQDSFIVAGVLYDLVSRGRVHHTYVWGGLLIVLAQCFFVSPNFE